MAKKNTNKGSEKDMEMADLKVNKDEDCEAIEAAGSELEAVTAEGASTEASQETQSAEPEQSELAVALEAALAKQEEYLDAAQRVKADFENFRRRNQNVRKEAYDDGARNFAATMLPVLDNMERAIEAARASTDPALQEGVEMVLRQFWETLEKHGVTVINRLGEKFDPNLENAVIQAAPEDGEPGTVSEVLQKGYQMGDVVLRYAMVKVVPE